MNQKSDFQILSKSYPSPSYGLGKNERPKSQLRISAEYLICPNPSEELQKFCEKNKMHIKKSLFDLKWEEVTNLSKIKILKSDACSLSIAFGYFMHFPIVEVDIFV